MVRSTLRPVYLPGTSHASLARAHAYPTKHAPLAHHRGKNAHSTCLRAHRHSAVCHAIHALLRPGDCPERVCAAAARGAVTGASAAVTNLSADATTPLNVSSTYASPRGLATCRRYQRCMARLGTSPTLTRTRPRHPRGFRVLVALTRKFTSDMSDELSSLCGPMTSSHASTRVRSPSRCACPKKPSMTSRTGSTAAPSSTSSIASGPSARTRTLSSDAGSVTPKLRCSCGVATFSARPSHRSCTLTSAPSMFSVSGPAPVAESSFLPQPNQELAMSFGVGSPTTSSTLTSSSPSVGKTQWSDGFTRSSGASRRKPAPAATQISPSRSP